jgi:hypothetical protein
MADYKAETFPFTNHGMVTKKQVAELAPGEFQYLQNVTSLQEGAITIRGGTQRKTDISGAITGLTHTIAKLRKTGVASADLRYVGTGQIIQRGPATDAGPFTTVADLGTPGNLQRWTSEDFAAGTSGAQWKFFATQQAMLKDDGAQSYPLPLWGILPPNRPVYATFDQIMAVIVGTSATGLSGVTSGGTADRLSGITLNAGFTPKLVDGVTTGAQYVEATVTGLTGVTVGQLLTVTGEPSPIPVQTIIVSPAAVGAIYTVAHSNGNTLSSPYAIYSVATSGDYTAFSGTVSADLSLSGLAGNGYDSPDDIHLSINLSDPTLFSAMSLDLDVSDSAGAYHDTYSIDIDLTNFGSGSWQELVFSKLLFTKIGRAGQPNNSWKLVKAFRINFTASGAATFWFGALYGLGGHFPNADSTGATQPLTPYDYLTTFRNDVTGAESNPCQTMVQELFRTPSTQYIRLFIGGTSDPQISTTAGHNTIAIYRRGGVFSDGLYRLIGFGTNPGYTASPGTGPLLQFLDNVPDANLVNATILEFDNDPPVTSNLPTTFTATISSSSPSIAGTGLIVTAVAVTTLTLSVQAPAGVSDLSTILTVGTPLTIGTGRFQEICNIAQIDPGGAGPLTVKVYCQYYHNPGDQVTASYVVGQPCYLTCQAFGSFFLAGDRNNPHILYKAKTARPEAWPIVNLEDGASGTIVVGSPSNPIMAITEFNGYVLVMNLGTFSLVSVWSGVMQNPIQAPVKRGLLASFAWCKVGNEIWYLAYDGIYSWAGGMERKRSEAINPIFLGQTVNGIAPIDTSIAGLKYCTMEYHNHEVNMIYLDTGGATRRLRYSLIYDRWYIVDDDPIYATFAMHLDQDTGNMVLAKYANGPNESFLDYDDVGTSDSWQTLPSDGALIPFTAFTGFYNLGTPAAQKHFGDLVLELNNDGAQSLTVSVFWDFSATADPHNTFNISLPQPPPGLGRRTVALPIVDAGGLTMGVDARAMAVQITGASAYPLTLYSLTFNSLPLQFQQRGRAYDWTDLGHPYDKKLEQLYLEYDMGQAGGVVVILCLDTLSGINGTTETLAVQTFPLGGSGRCTANFPINPDTRAKMVRLRPLELTDQTTSFMIWKSDFQMTKYPPDTTYFTEWSDEGLPYDKYWQQIDFDVDTGGTGAIVTFQLDGGTAQILPSFATTANARHINFTLNPNLKGKQGRLLIAPEPGGKFQMFAMKYITLPADKGPVSHSFDWDNLGHAFDKRLRTVSFEYDLNGSPNMTVQMDTLSGIKGSTINPNVQQFVLDGASRSSPTFPIKLDTIAKMVRFYPVSDGFQLKAWKYMVDKIDYPADIVFFTESDDMGYPGPKLLRELTLDLDSGGVPCRVDLEIDGAIHFSTFVTTTLNDKSRLITLPSRPNELSGLLFRLIFTPGVGGKASYFKHNFTHLILPLWLTHLSSFEQAFGDNGYHLAKQVFVDYICAGSLLVSLYTDNRQLFYQKTLPPHTGRDVERFYLPALNNGVLNKSRKYAIDFDAVDVTKPFQIFKDACRIEVKNMNGEQREAYRQAYIWQNVPVAGI